METFPTGAKRSKRMLRYDLVPKIALDRLASRFTGNPEVPEEKLPGGALQYGEGNWERGLPTSDVINHIINHLTTYQDKFRQTLTDAINGGCQSKEEIMNYVREEMVRHSFVDDDLAAAMWGCCVLMVQENHRMYHDDRFRINFVAKAKETEPALGRLIYGGEPYENIIEQRKRDDRHR